MVKFLAFIIFIYLVSCVGYRTTDEGGLWPSKLKFKDYTNLKTFKNESGIFLLCESWIGGSGFDSKNKKFYSNKKEVIKSYGLGKSVPFIRFLQNGNFYTGLFPVAGEFKKTDLNPLKGTIGKYTIFNNKIEGQHFMRVENYGKYVKCMGIKSGDTIHWIEKIVSGQIIHKIYVNKPISKSVELNIKEW